MVYFPHERYQIGAAASNKPELKIVFDLWCYLLILSREFQILKIVKYGCTAKEIARSLNTTYRTAEWHLKNIKRKLGTSSKIDVINFTKKLGIE